MMVLPVSVEQTMMVDVCFTDKKSSPVQWCPTTLIMCFSGRINITSVQEFRYASSRDSRLSSCGSSPCANSGILISHSTLTTPFNRACNGQHNCSIHNNANIMPPSDTVSGGYVHVNFTCVQEPNMDPTDRTTSSRTEILNSTGSSFSTSGSTSTNAIMTTVSTKAEPEITLKHDSYTNRNVSSIAKTIIHSTTSRISGSSSTTRNSTESTLRTRFITTSETQSRLANTSTSSKSQMPINKNTLATALRTEFKNFQVVPLAVGFVFAILLVVAVTLVIVLYRRGRFEKLLARVRRRNAQSSKNPPVFILSRGTFPDERKWISDNSDIHPGGIELPTNQTYDTNCTTGVKNQTYNHIQHQINNNFKTDATYNHIGELECNMSIIKINQTDMFSRFQQDGRGETGYGGNDPYSFLKQIAENELSAEGGCSQIDAFVALGNQENGSKGSKSGNQRLSRIFAEEENVYSIPVKSVKASNRDATQYGEKSKDPKHKTQPSLGFLEENSQVSDNDLSTHKYFVLQKVNMKT